MTNVVLAQSYWEGVDEGTEALLDQWMVGPGDRVVAGQAVANVVLVKTNIEVAAPASGTIDQILVPEEATFGRGRPLATMRED